MKRKGLLTATILFGLAILSQGQTASQDAAAWKYAQRVDELNAHTLDTFTLTGIYDTPPAHVPALPPSIYIECSKGKFQTASLRLNAVAQFSGQYSMKGISQAAVALRIDERNPDSDSWEISNDGTGLFFDTVQLDKLLTGSMIGHPSDQSKLTHRVLIGVTEALANQIVMRFNMPANADDLVLKCGLEYDRKRRKALEAGAQP